MVPAICAKRVRQLRYRPIRWVAAPAERMQVERERKRRLDRIWIALKARHLPL
jgi:hypothetical protein